MVAITQKHRERVLYFKSQEMFHRFFANAQQAYELHLVLDGVDFKSI